MSKATDNMGALAAMVETMSQIYSTEELIDLLDALPVQRKAAGEKTARAAAIIVLRKRFPAVDAAYVTALNTPRTGPAGLRQAVLKAARAASQ